MCRCSAASSPPVTGLSTFHSQHSKMALCTSQSAPSLVLELTAGAQAAVQHTIDVEGQAEWVTAVTTRCEAKVTWWSKLHSSSY